MSTAWSRIPEATIFVLAVVLVSAIFVEHNASHAAYYLLALGGFVALFRARHLSREEWAMVVVTLAVVFTAWLSYAYNGFEKRDWDRFLDAQTPLLGLIPIYFLARRFEMSAAVWWASVLGAVMCGALAVNEIYSSVSYWGFTFTFSKVWNGDYRVSADENPLPLAFTCVVLVGVLLAGGSQITRGRWWGRLLWISAMALSLATIVLSKSRGAWVIVPALVAVFLYVRWHGMPMRWRTVLVASMFALPLLAVSVPSIQDRLTSALSQFEQFDPNSDPGSASTSIGLRLDTYKAAWAAFLEKPLLGYGPGSWSEAYADAEQEGIAKGRVLPHPHNMYLSSLALRGVLGFAAEAAFFAVFGAYFFRRLRGEDQLVRDLALAGVLVIATILIMGLTWIPFGWWRKQVTLLAFLLAAIMGSIRYWELKKGRTSREPESPPAASL